MLWTLKHPITHHLVVDLCAYIKQVPKYKPKQPQAEKNGESRESRQNSQICGSHFLRKPLHSRESRLQDHENSSKTTKRTLQQRICKTQPQQLGGKSAELQLKGRLHRCKFQLAASLSAKAFDLKRAKVHTVPCNQQLQQGNLQKPCIGVIQK